MRKFKTESGHIVFELTRPEMTFIDSPGICDFCAAKPSVGFLIAVLNEWICPACDEKWEAVAKYFPEDMEIEKRNEEFYDLIYGGDDGGLEGRHNRSSKETSNQYH